MSENCPENGRKKCLEDMSPKFIEEFISKQPDVFNNFNPNGDPVEAEIYKENEDWAPTLLRACWGHQKRDQNDRNNQQKSWKRVIALGKKRHNYNLSREIPLAGVYLLGINQDATSVSFVSGTNGFTIHYPLTINGTRLGTSHELEEPYKDYGGSSKIENLFILGQSNRTLPTNTAQGVGTNGITIRQSSFIENCHIRGFGWNGIHIVADVRRETASNANRSTIKGCSIVYNGYHPGFDDNLITPENPLGHRHFGSGIMINGGDTNVCLIEHNSLNYNARFGIEDRNFLGNTHVANHVAENGHIVADWEENIYLSASANGNDVLADLFWTDGKKAGENFHAGYYCGGKSARNVIINPYTEMGATNYKGTMTLVLGGIGGKWVGPGRSITNKELKGRIEFVSPNYYGVKNRITFNRKGDSESTIIWSHDQPGLPNNDEYRFEFQGWVNNDPSYTGSNPSHPYWAGNYVYSNKGVNSRVIELITTTQSFSKYRNVNSRTNRGFPLKPGRKVFPAGFYFGNPATEWFSWNNQTASLPSAEDEVEIGSIAWNKKPSIGDYVGYILVSSGSSNVWRPFGKIE